MAGTERRPRVELKRTWPPLPSPFENIRNCSTAGQQRVAVKPQITPKTVRPGHELPAIWRDFSPTSSHEIGGALSLRAVRTTADGKQVSDMWVSFSPDGKSHTLHMKRATPDGKFVEETVVKTGNNR